ncbi:MAG: hypothetical protein C0399_11300 [Syntrophus sp. (in: bacteria)]|nr:hypothetical protein [Syntrophus sp. (in: bacteria)]
MELSRKYWESKRFIEVLMMIKETSPMTKNALPSSPMLSVFTRKRGDGFFSFTLYELIAAIILTCSLIVSVFVVITQTKKMQSL